jgi:hypothetical protein
MKRVLSILNAAWQFHRKSILWGLGVTSPVIRGQALLLCRERPPTPNLPHWYSAQYNVLDAFYCRCFSYCERKNFTPTYISDFALKRVIKIQVSGDSLMTSEDSIKGTFGDTRVNFHSQKQMIHYFQKPSNHFIFLMWGSELHAHIKQPLDTWRHIFCSQCDCELVTYPAFLIMLAMILCYGNWRWIYEKSFY